MIGRCTRRPVVFCILDGWGYRAERRHNAIALASTPTYDRVWNDSPHSLLEASAVSVGLPQGQMGNSEVGHTCLGSGRVVLQDMPRIDAAISDGSLANNQTLARLVSEVRKRKGRCHLMGLISPGGVHSHLRHVAALSQILDQADVPVLIHAFLDGRDTPPQSAMTHVSDLESGLSERVQIATVSGRHYAMDRDNRWDRVRLTYDNLVNGSGTRQESAYQAIQMAYDTDLTDEFVLPSTIGNYKGIADGDGLIMANFRSDRVREILNALVNPAFSGFERSRQVAFSFVAGMVDYTVELEPFVQPLFSSLPLENTLGESVGNAGMRQLRIAETEKYAHVTFFFNGGRECSFPGEDRVLVPSPKVNTYDEKPEMSAYEVTEKLVTAIRTREYDFIIANYANADMVGHTGDLPAAIMAVQAIDQCLDRLLEAVEYSNGILVITADHGNVECMQEDQTGQPMTAHTTEKVPLIICNAPFSFSLLDGDLSDVAPTLLHLLGLTKPSDMTGKSLIVSSTSGPD